MKFYGHAPNLVIILAFILSPFSAFAGGPTVTTGSASSVTGSTATLAGNVTSLGGSASITERGFQYGTTGSYGQTESETGTYSTGSFSLGLSGLTCETTYYYRAYAVDDNSTTGYGSQQTFTSGDCPTTPSLSNTSASGVSTSAATLSTSIYNGSTVTTRGFEYGLTTSYGTTDSESVSSDSSIVFDSSFGSSGSGDGQLSGPLGIAVDSSGNVYVVDSGNDRIQKFDSSGTYVSQFGSSGSGDGEFDFSPSNSAGLPTGVATDSSDNVYVVDSGNSRVQKFDSSGTYLSQFGSNGSGDGEFVFPVGIAIDSSGNIYVVDFGAADSGDNRVQKFNSSGTYVSQFGTSGSGNGEFAIPTGIAIDSSDNIYVGDFGSLASGDNRVQKFNSSGTYVSQFGTSGSGNGEFAAPVSLSVDLAGYIYVIDSGYALSEEDRVQVFNPSGDYVLKFGTNGSGDGEFDYPVDIAFSSDDDYLYVVDLNNDRVVKFSAGNFSSDISGLTCGTTYHYRSFATTSAGTGYSDDDTFTTSDCPEVAQESSSSSRISTGSYVRSRSSSVNSIVDGDSDNRAWGNEASCSPFTTLMKFGSKFGEVSKLQQALENLGYSPGPTDGLFGPLTDGAVKSFQSVRRIDVDGIVGPQTRGVLNEGC